MGAFYLGDVDLGDHHDERRFDWEEGDNNGRVPLYESKLFDTYDHRFGTFAQVSRQKIIDGKPRKCNQEEKRDPHFTTHPRYFVRKKFVEELYRKYPNYNSQWLLLWRDVARATDERTCITTVVPRVASARNTCPALGVRQVAC